MEPLKFTSSDPGAPDIDPSPFQSIGLAERLAPSMRTVSGSAALSGVPSQCLVAAVVFRALSRKLELLGAYHLGRYGRFPAPRPADSTKLPSFKELSTCPE